MSASKNKILFFNYTGRLPAGKNAIIIANNRNFLLDRILILLKFFFYLRISGLNFMGRAKFLYMQALGALKKMPGPNGDMASAAQIMLCREDFLI